MSLPVWLSEPGVGVGSAAQPSPLGPKGPKGGFHFCFWRHFGSRVGESEGVEEPILGENVADGGGGGDGVRGSWTEQALKKEGGSEGNQTVGSGGCRGSITQGSRDARDPHGQRGA